MTSYADQRRLDDADARRLDDADARRLKQEALDGRKRAAFLVLASEEGTMEKAAAAGRTDRRTLRKWIAERESR